MGIGSLTRVFPGLVQNERPVLVAIHTKSTPAPQALRKEASSAIIASACKFSTMRTLLGRVDSPIRKEVLKGDKVGAVILRMPCLAGEAESNATECTFTESLTRTDRCSCQQVSPHLGVVTYAEHTRNRYSMGLQPWCTVARFTESPFQSPQRTTKMFASLQRQRERRAPPRAIQLQNIYRDTAEIGD